MYKLQYTLQFTIWLVAFQDASQFVLSENHAQLHYVIREKRRAIEHGFPISTICQLINSVNIAYDDVMKSILMLLGYYCKLGDLWKSFFVFFLTRC